MSQTSVFPSKAATAARSRQMLAFRKKGIAIALSSAVLYGFYTAFMTLGMTKGIWAEWAVGNTGNAEGTKLSPFAATFLIGALGAATTDTCSACWALMMSIIRGRFGDFLRCIKSKPGLVMVAAAIIGGPLASTCYVIGLQKAGPIIVPISALCPAVGSIIGRFLFKQPLTPRIMFGIAICFSASFMIGSTGLTEEAHPDLMTGILFGFIAACCWGIEGCICGYGTSMIDPEVAITIRQTTSGLSNMIILVPLFGMLGGADSFMMTKQALTDSSAMVWFILAGLSAYLTFMFWYKGTGMCGAALGMSCNGTFSFWGPFCCWLVLGVVSGLPGYNMAPIAWVAAMIMIVGIFTIALNPLSLLKRSKKSISMPLNYAMLAYFTNVKEACVDDVVSALEEQYGNFSAFKRNSINNAMMTAAANDLIAETKYELDAIGNLRVYYAATEGGADMINRYIKKN